MRRNYHEIMESKRESGCLCVCSQDNRLLIQKASTSSAQMLPKEKRWATFALYGFCRHCDNLIDTPRQRTETEILRENQRLTEELQGAYNTRRVSRPDYPCVHSRR